jgi:hypothetical protein
MLRQLLLSFKQQSRCGNKRLAEYSDQGGRAAARCRADNGRRFTARRMAEKNLHGTGRSTERPSRPPKRQRVYENQCTLTPVQD